MLQNFLTLNGKIFVQWICIALSLVVLVAPERLSLSATTGPQRMSWAVKAQRLLHLPEGNANYLSAYGDLMEFLWGKNGVFLDQKQVPNVTTALRLVLKSPKGSAALRLIVDDIAGHGVSPVLLRDQILRTVTLTGKSMRKEHHPWRYFTPWKRRMTAYLFAFRAKQLAALAKTSRASDYARTWIFLNAQDDLEFSALTWLATDTKFMEASGFPISVIKKFPPLYRRELTAFKHRYKSGVAMYDFARKFENSRGPIPPSVAGDYIKLLRAAINIMRGHLHDEYQLLRGVSNDRRRFAAAGHQSTSKKISDFLRTWGKSVRHDTRMSKLKRGALLRWIKEASL